MHRVSWRNGRLILHDHDIAAEQVLQALGGEPCACLLLLDAFRGVQAGLGGAQSSRPPTTSQARSRTSSHLAPIPASMFGASRLSGGARVRPPRANAGPAVMLQWLQSDPSFLRQPANQRRRILAQAQLQVARQFVPEELTAIFILTNQVRANRYGLATEPRVVRLSAEERLQAAAHPAVQQAVQHWQPFLRPQASIAISCWKQRPGEARILQGDLTSRGGFVALSLPLSWLNRVWARGLACVDGHFMLDVDASAPRTELHGEAVRWERRFGGHAVPVPVACRITRRAGIWQLVR
jgi:hypothetical protein